MPTQSLAHIRDAFNAFRVESVWLQTVHNTFCALYSSGPETDKLLQNTAPVFFHDLNSIFIEYWILIICRLTDPAKMNGRKNLTAKNLVENLRELGMLTEPIEREANGLQRYRDVLNTARNRVVSHADKDTFLQPELIGEHSQDELTSFLAHLQRFNDLVGEAIGEGPLDFSATSGSGDAYDLLRALRNAA